VKITGTEKSRESNDDQINADNIVQQPGHDQNEKTGDKRHQRGKAQGDMHGGILFREDDASKYWYLTPFGRTVLVRLHVCTRDTIAPASRAICDILAANVGIVRKARRGGQAYDK
jgi:hypothetical protein